MLATSFLKCFGYVENVELFSASDDGFNAFQGKTGMRFQLGGGFSWNLGYRYVQTDDISNANNFENMQHVLETGVRWQL